jgi:hypothetical protein
VVQGLEERTTPRQSTTHLSQLEYSIPNTSDSSIDGSTLALSTESFETLVNTSGVSLTTQATATKGPQSAGRGVSHASAISRQPAMRLPQPEMAVNVSEVPPPRCVAAANPLSPQSVNSGPNQATSRQSIALQPLQKPSNPDTNVPRIGGNTLSPPSSDRDCRIA